MNNLKFLVILLFPIVAASGFVSYKNAFAKITFSSSDDVSVSVYKSPDAEAGTSYDSKDLVLDQVPKGTYKLKRGSYVYVAGGQTNGFSEQAERIDVSGAKNVVINLKFDDKKLSELQPEATSQVQALLNSMYPEQMKQFSLSGGKLYEKGDWYAARLVPNNPGQLDTYSFVARKKGATWEMATNPPEIVVSKPVYPDIPDVILVDLSASFKQSL